MVVGAPRYRWRGEDVAMTVEADVRPTGQRQLITIDEILLARPQRPVASTRERGWGGITVDLHRPYFNCAESYSGLDHHVICFCPSGTAKLVQSRSGSVHRGVISGGVSLIMPAGYDSTWEGESGLSARLRIPPSLIDLAAEQLGRRSASQVEIRNVFEVRDPIIEQLTRIMLAEIELRQHPAQILLINSVSAAIAAHMLRRYNVFEPVEEEAEHALGREELKRLTSFIEDNLDRTINLDELAALVGVSRFHFCRLFKKSTGFTAINYVEHCRIRRAQTLIVETDLSLAEVALTIGFADQSHFTRRFRRHVGCTPAVFAREQGRRRGKR
jgi:AraC family transcriptional regulator